MNAMPLLPAQTLSGVDRIHHGDALSVLRKLPSGIAHMIVTSPPYYWQRDYGVDEQLGHEQTPQQYVEALRLVFHEAMRVLSDDGIFYLNIADTYYSGNGQPKGSDPRCSSRNFMREKLRAVDVSGWNIPKKSLIGIPFMVATALQSDGWTWRSTIIWNRLNAFVEPSVTDRPYRQYEYLFLFSKSRWYYYDRTQLDGDEDVWNIPAEKVKGHNAAYPIALASRCVRTGCPAGGVVLDPFFGSGTTGKAAIESGRHYIGIELNAAYISIAGERLSGAQLPLFAVTA